uniref:NADH-ubiquinone oxidoreductase chain 6 n=1 Tax=Sisyra nigra TaxID=279440 RepID=A0A1S5QY27_9NEOP|nr:NADH dehydrogenase subunit 6 [Sisyra nigra]
MNKIIFLMNFFISLNFFYLNHPLAAGLMLILQTIMLSLLCGLLSSTYWFSYILFLVMLGGMLILFIYMTSIASNELIKFSMNKFLTMILIFSMIILMSYYIDNYFFLNNNMEMSMINHNLYFMNSENQMNLMKLYNNPTMNITLMMITYLLLTFIIIIKIIKLNSAPLRSNY